MSTALVLTPAAQHKAVSRLASLETRLKNMRDRFEGMAPKVQNTAIQAGVGYVYGRAEADFTARRAQLFTVLDLPPAMLYGVVAFAVGEWMGGRMGEVIHSASNSLASIAGYNLGKEGGSRPNTVAPHA